MSRLVSMQIAAKLVDNLKLVPVDAAGQRDNSWYFAWPSEPEILIGMGSEPGRGQTKKWETPSTHGAFRVDLGVTTEMIRGVSYPSYLDEDTEKLFTFKLVDGVVEKQAKRIAKHIQKVMFPAVQKKLEYLRQQVNAKADLRESDVKLQIRVADLFGETRLVEHMTKDSSYPITVQEGKRLGETEMTVRAHEGFVHIGVNLRRSRGESDNEHVLELLKEVRSLVKKYAERAPKETLNV